MGRLTGQALIRHKEQMTAIGGLWVITGFHQTGVLIDKDCREGTSYGFWRRADIFTASITSFSEKPLYAVFFLGLGMFILSLLVGIYIILVRIIIGTALEGWVSAHALFHSGPRRASFCCAWEWWESMFHESFIETKNRPYVIIRNKYGLPDCQT